MKWISYSRFTDEDLGIEVLKTPATPEYSTFQSRQDSYEKYWPAALKQTPAELAKAGFFYTG